MKIGSEKEVSLNKKLIKTNLNTKDKLIQQMNFKIN